MGGGTVPLWQRHKIRTGRKLPFLLGQVFLLDGFALFFPQLVALRRGAFILGSQGGEVEWLVRSVNTQSHAAQTSRFLTKWSFHVWSRARTKFSLLLLQALLFWEVISLPFALYEDFCSIQE
jgi:hypothetical protein